MEIMKMLEKLHYTNLLWQIITPLIFSLVDIITGYIQAVINNNVDSQKMRIGLLHKCLILLVIILSYIIQFAFGLNYIAGFVCIYVVLMELVSIAENLQKAGLDIGKLADILKDKKED